MQAPRQYGNSKFHGAGVAIIQDLLTPKPIKAHRTAVRATEAAEVQLVTLRFCGKLRSSADDGRVR
jgi:hypothetical protein